MSPLAHCSINRYAEGGEVEERGLESVGGLSALAALALAHPRARHLAKRFVNSAARPAQRALKHPVVATEAVSKTPLDEAGSDALMKQALGEIDHPYSKLAMSKQQGAWMGDTGMEYNPLYTQQLPRRLGAMENDQEALKYSAMLGQKLDQQGVPIMRSMRQPFDIADDSDALLTNPIPGGALRQLAEQLGSDVVVSQQPSGEALIFSLGDKPLHDIRSLIEKQMPDVKPRFAVSRPGMDRLVVTEQDWGAPNKTRSEILGE